MESILEYVRRKLREAGSHQWEVIAQEVGATPTTPRKLVYDRTNPGVNTVEPFYAYFKRLDAAVSRPVVKRERRKVGRDEQTNEPTPQGLGYGEHPSFTKER